MRFFYLSLRAIAVSVAIRFLFVGITDCHTSDIGHWFAMTLCFYVTLNGVKSLFRFFAALRMTGGKALRMTMRGPRRSPAKRVRWGKGRRREYSAVFAEAETERYELLLTLSLRANAVSVAIRKTLGVKRNGLPQAASRLRNDNILPMSF